MATQPERIAALEADHKGQWRAIVAVATVGAAWMGWLSIMLFGMKGDIQALKQKVKDGGTGDIVSELKQPKSPQQLQASLNTVIAEIQTAHVEGKKPDNKKSAALSTALYDVAKGHPNLPEAWRAAATLVSFQSTNVASLAPSLPECDVTVKPRMIEPSEVPEIPLRADSARKGFLFRNCRLNMDRLPSGELIQATNPNMPGDIAYIGWVAFVINSEVILNDSGIIHTSVEQFNFVGCRLQYEIDQTPQKPAQRMLLASLRPNPFGQISLDLSGL